MITVAQWQHWEIRRYLDAQSPGKFGYFGNEVTK